MSLLVDCACEAALPALSMSKNAKNCARGEERLSLCEDGKECKNAHVRVKESTGGVCMWARTDSLATHHYSVIITQLTTEVFNLVVD